MVRGYVVVAYVTVWNMPSTAPKVALDYNNVLNVFEVKEVLEATGLIGASYAIVSFLKGKGDNFKALKERAKTTGECIVAVTADITNQDKRSIKYEAIKALKWTDIIKWAVDDQPHMWYVPRYGIVMDPPRTGRRVKMLCKRAECRKDIFKIDMAHA